MDMFAALQPYLDKLGPGVVALDALIVVGIVSVLKLWFTNRDIYEPGPDETEEYLKQKLAYLTETRKRLYRAQVRTLSLVVCLAVAYVQLYQQQLLPWLAVATGLLYTGHLSQSGTQAVLERQGVLGDDGGDEPPQPPAPARRKKRAAPDTTVVTSTPRPQPPIMGFAPKGRHG